MHLGNKVSVIEKDVDVCLFEVLYQCFIVELDVCGVSDAACARYAKQDCEIFVAAFSEKCCVDGVTEFAVLAFCVSCYCHGVEGVGAVAFFVDSIIFFITDKYLIFKFCAYSFYEIVDSFGVVKCNHFYGFLSFLYLF